MALSKQSAHFRFLVSVSLGVLAAFFTLFSLDYMKNYNHATSFTSYSQPAQCPLPDVAEPEKPILANVLWSKVRVCTWVMTYNKNHDKCVAVRDTWGKRVNRLIFMSNEEDPSLPAINIHVEDGRDHLWRKTKVAYKYMFDHYLEECDWFMKTDDDTFLITENLRYLLSTYSPVDPIYFGSNFKPLRYPKGYMSGGGGYVLSKRALTLFIKEALSNDTLCKQEDKGAEDAELGKCLYNIGVVAGDSRDHFGRGRFFPLKPSNHVLENYRNPNWYYRYRYYSIPNGTAGCSDTAISFHYVKPADMYIMNYFLYHLRPFGVAENHQFPMPLPPDLKVVPNHVLQKYGLRQNST